MYISEIHIPFRRKSDDATSINAELENVFCTSSNMLCDYKGTKIDADKGYFGCISDNQTPNNTVSKFALINHNFNLIQMNDIDTNYSIHIYEIPNDNTISYEVTYEIYPQTYIFNKALSMSIESDSIQPFVNNDNTIKIECDRCDFIEVVGCSKTNRIEPTGKNEFLFKPTCVENHILNAWCNSSKQDYCYFEESFANDGLALLTYNDITGVDDENTNTSNKLTFGFKKQLIYQKELARYSKTWKGQIQKVSNIKPGNLTFILSYKDDECTIQMKLDDLQIPFSMNNMMMNFDRFIELLGIDIINEESNGFVDFTDNGEIVVKTNHFDESKLQKSYAGFFAGVSDDYIKNVSFEKEKSHEKGLTIIIICASCFACLIIISVLSIFIIKHNRARNEVINDNC